jgi:hypothetical protein
MLRNIKNNDWNYTETACDWLKNNEVRRNANAHLFFYVELEKMIANSAQSSFVLAKLAIVGP